MDDLIKLVRTLRFTTGLSERLRLTEEIIRSVAPDLTVFLYGRLPPDMVPDALQETLKAVATSINRFEGDTPKAFLAWCYRIARNKAHDEFRDQDSDHTLILEPEELRQLIDSTAEEKPITAQNRLDLDYAMKLLAAAKPGCDDLLWRHYVMGLDYGEIAAETALSYDAVRMKITRCLDEAKSLVS